MDVRKGVYADRAQVVANPKLAGLVKGKDIADPCICEGLAARAYLFKRIIFR